MAPVIPKTSDEAALNSAFLPPPVVQGASITPVHADYYYRMKEWVIYQTYAFHLEGKEPPGCWEKLRQVGPKVVFDASKLRTPAD